MKSCNKQNNMPLQLFQTPSSRVKQLKSILLILGSVLFGLALNNFVIGDGSDTLEYVIGLILMLLYYTYTDSDTTNIVSGMLIWSMLIFVSYLAWQGDGLYDTGIVAYPCISLFAFLLGGPSLLAPLTLCTFATFYFLAYASYENLLVHEINSVDNLWAKANVLSLIILVFNLGLFFISKYINRLIKNLKTESTKNLQFQKEVEQKLLQDFMTGLPNETVCQTDLSKLLTKSNIKNDFVGVATLDLKNFQWINSSLGHDIGDHVICMVSDRLRKLMDDQKSLYRSSGNEFIMLIKAADYEEISNFCHQIMQVLQHPFEIEDYDIELSGHIGIATAPFDGTSYKVLRQKSHMALYQAKEDEEPPYCFFDIEMEQQVSSKINLVHELKRAVNDQEFELFYQPKIDLQSGEIAGAEALIRWRKSDGTMVSPTQFIPAAEESGLINEIGKWALEQACKDCKGWHENGYQISIAVNLSPVQFKRGNLPNIVFQALKNADLDAHYLELEITESLFIDDAEHTKEQILQFVDKGIAIAIDDFGTGYSNLNYLAKFNASTLKIDMSFVRNMLESVQHLHIVNAIISMAEVMELECVAEGVEDIAIANKLKQLGCTYGQGYMWSKPLPFKEFAELLLPNKQH